MNDWGLYEKGKEYNAGLNYNIEVAKNWRFYNLRHLDHLKFGGQTKVKVPMAQNIVNRGVATCMTKTVKMNYKVENISDNTQDKGEQTKMLLAKYLSQGSTIKWETLKMDSLIRTILFDGANSGDMALHTYFDATYDTGQTLGEREVLDEKGNPTFDEIGLPITEPVPILGDFWTEAVDGSNIYLGNPNDPRINFRGKPHQPYVIVSGRDTVMNLREEATEYSKKTNEHPKENELSKDDIKNILPDEDNLEQAGDRGKKELEVKDEYGKATYIIKYWHKNGKIYFNKSVKGCMIRKDVDTGLTLYPVAWANWGIVKNSYHGQAIMTGLTENQLALDRAWMALFKYLNDMALPKAIANKAYFPNGLTNKSSEVIWYDGMENVSPNNVLQYTTPGQMANGIIELLEIFKKTTMELLGATDTVLGNVNPENATAMFANVQNSVIPLENVKAHLHQLIEDQGYIWLDFMLHKFKVPRMIPIDDNGVTKMVEFDPSLLDKAKFTISVDVISGSYIDEISAMRVIENLFTDAQISVVQFIERLPDGMIPEKEKLLSELKAKLNMEQTMQTEAYKAQIIEEFMGKVQEKIEQPAV